MPSTKIIILHRKYPPLRLAPHNLSAFPSTFSRFPLFVLSDSWHMLISVSIKLFAQLPSNTFRLATRPTIVPLENFFSRHSAPLSCFRPPFHPLFHPLNDPRRSHNSFEKIASQYLCVGFFISWIFPLLLLFRLATQKGAENAEHFSSFTIRAVPGFPHILNPPPYRHGPIKALKYAQISRQ